MAAEELSAARAAIPAMANAHSHAFQIALRGSGERPGGAADDDFWSWRTEMFRVANHLDPASIGRLSGRAFSEMAAAGYGAVGEFHYVHHRPDGSPYDDPNALAKAVATAATAAGLEIALLPAAYHRGGWDGGDLPPAPGQLRFCDPSVDAFLERVDELREWARPRPGVSVGIAAHSARAVPAAWLERIAEYSEAREVVRHVHASEQPRELEEVRAEHGCSPIELLDRTGFLGERASVIHAIHVSERDVELLAGTGTTVVTCPTTEGNLGDGWFPALAYRDAGVPIAIGSDSQLRIDPFEEARELETGARRERRTRHALLASSGDLWEELARTGCRSIGLDGAGTITVDRTHPQLACVDAEDLPLALVTAASSAVVVPARRA
jgi:formimidoylglutamate deiminase